MLDSTDSLDERLARRRARRWQRRARIAGPFLAVPAMLGLLVLSVDLIEYRPAARSDGPLARTRAASPVKPGPARDALIQAPVAALAVSVVEAPRAGEMPEGASTAMGATAPNGETASHESPLPVWLGESAGRAGR